MRRLWPAMLAVILLLSACSAKEERPEGAVYIYYQNLQGSALVSKDYVPQAQEPRDQAEELLTQMMTAPDTDVVSVLDGRFTVNSLEQTGSILKLYLEGDRSVLNYNTYLLMLSALTRTLTQPEGVDAILVYINGETVTDNGGRAFGLMRPALFANNAGQDEDDYRVSEIRLFFANESGTRLTEVTKTVRDSNNVQPERTVMRELIAGPSSPKAYAVVPQGVSVLSVNTRDGVCYLNLDDAFVTGMEAGRETLAVYAIVNSLTSLDGIDKVQFSINGETNVTLGLSKLSLAEPFAFNIDIVEIKE